MKPNLKILVCYHKPAKLYKDDIYVPIHVGRSLATQESKDGTITNDEYAWMLDNMIGDDTGENISHLNRHFSELTAIYWAWKNYENLGNPDYIGLEHYRRRFKKEDIVSFDQYDITAPSEECTHILHQFRINHYSDKLDLAFAMTLKEYPEMQGSFTPFSQLKETYFFNMFIMKKELFFEYCAFLFNIVMQIHEQTNYQNESFYNQRLPGFLTERLGSFFFFHKAMQDVKLHTCTVERKEETLPVTVTPAFAKERREKSINVCLSADNNYAPYLAVTIMSIKENAHKEDKYDICILEDEISRANKNKILSLKNENFSIRFFDVSSYLANFDKEFFYINGHLSITTYYRLFIPLIFKEYDRILYLDSDLIIHMNLAQLYNTDLKGKTIGAVLDIGVLTRVYSVNIHYKSIWYDYLSRSLQLKTPEKYFQAGVLLFDIKKLQKINFIHTCMNKLKEIKHPRLFDQCVLNAVFNGDITYCDLAWNVLWHIPRILPEYIKVLPIQVYLKYEDSRKNPKIIHYAGSIKPWKAPDEELADIWWKYARLTPFYEDILFRNTKEVANKNKEKLTLSRLLRETGNYEAVHELMEEAIEISPYWAEPYIEQAKTFDIQGEIDLAIEYAKKAVTVESHNRMHKILLANLLRRAGKFDAVIELMSEAEQLLPQWSEPQAQYAMIYEAKGELDKALECAKKALAIAPENTLRQSYFKHIMDKINTQKSIK